MHYNEGNYIIEQSYYLTAVTFSEHNFGALLIFFSSRLFIHFYFGDGDLVKELTTCDLYGM